VSATCMQGSVIVCVHLPTSLSVHVTVQSNLINESCYACLLLTCKWKVQLLYVANSNRNLTLFRHLFERITKFDVL